LHCFFEFGHLFVDLVVQRFFLCHVVSAMVGCVWEGGCHCLLASNSQSVIEEKGEGFENGKILLACWM
jgi:hypothetical protein